MAQVTPFGTAQSGETVTRHVLSAGELSVAILSWGAAVQDVRLNGVNRSLTLGSDRLADYEGAMRHHGTLIGPIANRISPARVTIDGMTYELERNQDGRVHLHSGKRATHRRQWTVVEDSDTHITLECTLIDGECGLPGNRTIRATYDVVPPATLRLTVTGTTDTRTLMNFANHSYWNLDGTDRYDGHRLEIDAARYLPVTEDFYPTGEVVEVAGTEMDFRSPRAISVGHPPLDNNFCLSEAKMPLRDVLTLTGRSGVRMTIATDQPGIQVYDGRDAIRPGKDRYEGLAIEAQGWPDAPTHPRFPSIEVTPEAPYAQVTEWRFAAS